MQLAMVLKVLVVILRCYCRCSISLLNYLTNRSRGQGVLASFCSLNIRFITSISMALVSLLKTERPLAVTCKVIPPVLFFIAPSSFRLGRGVKGFG